MVRIISGWTGPGGSTTALINLTNALNDNGIETVMMGKNPWYCDKCISEPITDKLNFKSSDTLMFHYIQLPKRPNAKKVLLACHEKWWFKIGDINKYWDIAIFLHDEHRNYHKQNGYKGNYVIIPNLKENLKKSDKTKLDKIAGIIGTIEPRKQTHISIKRAFDDGCKKVILFGHIGNNDYFNEHIKPLLEINQNLNMAGYCDKQKIYDQIDRVYHSSIGEVASLVKDECFTTGTKFFGNEETNNQISNLTNGEILKLWKEICL